MKSKAQPNLNVLNRRARFDYELGEELIAGVVLSGPQVRAVRDGRVSLKGAFVTVKQGPKGQELWLNNASFSLKNTGEGDSDTIDTSPKKLLASRKQIEKLASEKQAGQTIIPLKIIGGSRYIKVVIAPGKGKKLHDKRETIKRRQTDRDNAKAMRNY